MTAPDPPADDADPTLAIGRLRLDLEDLRFENERLKASIAQRQDEIVALSERLQALQSRRASGLGGHVMRYLLRRVIR